MRQHLSWFHLPHWQECWSRNAWSLWDLKPYRKLAKAGEFALKPGRFAIAGSLAASIGVALLKSGCEVYAGIAGHCLWHAHLEHGLIYRLCTHHHTWKNMHCPYCLREAMHHTRHSSTYAASQPKMLLEMQHTTYSEQGKASFWSEIVRFTGRDLRSRLNMSISLRSALGCSMCSLQLSLWQPPPEILTALKPPPKPEQRPCPNRFLAALGKHQRLAQHVSTPRSHLPMPPSTNKAFQTVPSHKALSCVNGHAFLYAVLGRGTTAIIEQPAGSSVSVYICNMHGP